MQIIIENEYGRIGMGGSRHPYFRITDAEGLGFMVPERNVCTYAGEYGQSVISSVYGARTITISAEMATGGRVSREEILRIISDDVLIKIEKGSKRRQISARCVSFDEGKANRVFRKVVFQFICDSPYFEDLTYTSCDLFRRESKIIGGVTEFDTVFSVRSNTADIYNKGSCTAEPIISIYCSADSEDIISIKNNSVGAVCEVCGGVTGGEVIQIDIPERCITSSLRGDITNLISENTVLSKFVLTKGKNSFEVISENVNISCALKYKNKYMEAIV